MPRRRARARHRRELRDIPFDRPATAPAAQPATRSGFSADAPPGARPAPQAVQPGEASSPPFASAGLDTSPAQHLENLRTALAAVAPGLFAKLVQRPGQTPFLHVNNPAGAGRFSEDITVQPGDRPGHLWFCWSWGERITPVTTPQTAAAAILRVLAVPSGQVNPVDPAVQSLRSHGAAYPVGWADAAAARDLAARLAAEHSIDRTEIVRNPHRDGGWVKDAACALLDLVQAVLGADVAIENTFLILKWPGTAFEVPWHQDGTDRRIELDPERSVSAWLALTDASPANGCLHIAPGSHQLGYLPHGPEADHGAQRGRAGQALLDNPGFVNQGAVPVPVTAGNAAVLDSRLLHRSGPNTSNSVRVGLNVRYVAPGAVRTRDGSTPVLDPISGTAW